VSGVPSLTIRIGTGNKFRSQRAADAGLVHTSAYETALPLSKVGIDPVAGLIAATHEDRFAHSNNLCNLI